MEAFSVHHVPEVTHGAVEVNKLFSYSMGLSDPCPNIPTTGKVYLWDGFAKMILHDAAQK